MRFEFIKEENSIFIVPTIRVSYERNWNNKLYYLYIDFSWFNRTFSVNVIDTE